MMGGLTLKQPKRSSIFPVFHHSKNLFLLLLLVCKALNMTLFPLKLALAACYQTARP